MVIEYIGTIIRNEVANRKEKLYESQVRVFVHSFFPLPHSDIHKTKQMLCCLISLGPLIRFLLCHKCK